MAGKPYEPLIDVARAAEVMGISTQNLRALVRSGQLAAITFAGSGGTPVYRFRPSDVDRAIRRIHNAKGFSAVYADSVWKAPPPRPRQGMSSRRGRPPIAFDLARAEELRKAGKGYVEIAREVGVSSTTVANALRSGRREILSGPGRRSVEFDLEKAVALRREGKTFVEIAAELGGISTGIVSNAVRAAAPELARPAGFRDRDAVARMLTMRREGASYREIGDAFGLRADTVARGLRPFGIRTPPVRRGAPRAEIDSSRALQMRRDGSSYARIAQEFGVNTATVSRAIRQNSGLKGSKFAFDIKRAMEMRRQGCGYAAIAKAVGVSRPTVTNAIKVKMLSVAARNPEPPFLIDVAARMRRERKSYKAIGAALGVSAQTVAIHLKRRGVQVNVQSGPRFDLNLARRLQGEGMALAEIARQCGVSRSTLARYLNPRAKRSPKADTPGQPSPSAPS
ncbi:MAG TPA: helix-turn-helix domain-containing protein [Terracidiphilus sp.]|nr:helix-turn-helix domain-containing protein [Terracidiphilus sp.]